MDVDPKLHRTRFDMDYRPDALSIVNDGATTWIFGLKSNQILRTNAISNVFSPNDPSFRLEAPNEKNGLLRDVPLSKWLQWVLFDRWNAPQSNFGWKTAPPQQCSTTGSQEQCWVLKHKKESVWIDTKTASVIRYGLDGTSLKLSRVGETLSLSASANRFNLPANARFISDVAAHWLNNSNKRVQGTWIPDFVRATARKVF